MIHYDAALVIYIKYRWQNGAPLLPTSVCRCGCKEDTGLGRFFLSGYDRQAEGAVVEHEHGSVAEPLNAGGHGLDKRNSVNAKD